MINANIISISSQNQGGSGSNFSAAYQAVLTRAGVLGYTTPSGTVQSAQNTFMVDTASILAKFDIFYIFANGGSTQNFSLINIVSPNNFTADLPTAITYSTGGFRGNGVDQYISTNWNAATNGVNYTNNSACRVTWVHAIYTTSSRIDGLITTTARNCFSNQSSTSLHKINQGSTVLAATLDFSGTDYKAIDRPDATNVHGQNALVRTSTTAASSGVLSEEQTIFKSGTGFGDPTLSMYGCGSSLSEAEHNTLRNNFNTYMTAIGL